VFFVVGGVWVSLNNHDDIRASLKESRSFTSLTTREKKVRVEGGFSKRSFIVL